MEHVLLAAEEANQSQEEPEIAQDEDENRKITTAEELKSKKIHRSQQNRPFKHVFNKLIESVEQMKLNNKKVIIEGYLDLKIYFIYTVYLYRMKNILNLNFCCLFLPKKSKTLYSGHLVIANAFLRNSRCPL